MWDELAYPFPNFNGATVISVILGSSSIFQEIIVTKHWNGNVILNSSRWWAGDALLPMPSMTGNFYVYQSFEIVHYNFAEESVLIVCDTFPHIVSIHLKFTTHNALLWKCVIYLIFFLI